MKIYNCDICSQLIYFENTLCMNCNTQLGYLPKLDNMSSLELVDEFTWKALAPSAQSRLYKKCENFHKEKACNWMIPIDVDEDFCLSCRLNDVIPNLSVPENREYWIRFEVAKRRLVYSLLCLGLPIRNKEEDVEKGLAFSFLVEEQKFSLKESKKVLTGHEKGNIIFNIAEANDAVREKMRLDMNERYRTLLGHFRHEIGHYYWFLFIENNQELLNQFRQLFGNEEADYNKSLKTYYALGAPKNWQESFVSAYASAHAWEDWAESWAHYLHMFDTIETARSWGLTVDLKNGKEFRPTHMSDHLQTFEEMKNQWVVLSCALNSLNRSMGMKDVYPFSWSEKVIEKLRFIQQVIINFKEQV